MTDAFTTLKPMCGHCRFYEPQQEQCRRYAPRPGADMFNAIWPWVADDEWCGEYQLDPECM